MTCDTMAGMEQRVSLVTPSVSSAGAAGWRESDSVMFLWSWRED
jgi:hypothetical protein